MKTISVPGLVRIKPGAMARFGFSLPGRGETAFPVGLFMA